MKRPLLTRTLLQTRAGASAVSGVRLSAVHLTRSPRRRPDAARRTVDLTAWIGRTETAADTVTPTPVRRAAPPRSTTRSHRSPAGTPLPPLWHWLYFLPLHRQSEIGPDGHAKRGGFLPPVPLPRRMWAGSQFEFRVADARRRRGRCAPRRSTTSRSKDGRTGPLVFVKVRHEVRCNGARRPGAGRVPRHRLPRARSSPATSSRRRSRRRPARRGSARSCPTTCCCSATRR